MKSVSINGGRTPQGVRGLKRRFIPGNGVKVGSHSARSAWIETPLFMKRRATDLVALRKECVD